VADTPRRPKRAGAKPKGKPFRRAEAPPSGGPPARKPAARGAAGGPLKKGPRRDGPPRRTERSAPAFNAGRDGAGRDGGRRDSRPPRRDFDNAEPRPSWRSSSNWLDLALSLVQAPVGLAQSQVERLVGELVKTGQLGQREAEKLLNEVRRARVLASDKGRSEADRLDHFIEQRIEEVLNRVNIPSRSDIDRLNVSVEVLTSKVEALLSRQAGSDPAS
jgi:poly(hydroxyalkanoate) granule-associated protein